MNLIFSFAALLTFIATLPAHTAPTSTLRFIAALTDELEAKVIGEDELVALIESADAGRVANPICEATAELSAARLLAYQNFQQYVDAADLDATAIAAWARANLVEQERGRARREANRKDTTLPWKVDTARAMVSGSGHTCAINESGKVQCWGKNENGQIDVPSDLGVVQSISAYNLLTCAVTADGRVKCWGGGWNPFKVTSGFDRVRSVAVGADCICIVQVDGFVKCWGDPSFVPTDLGGVLSVSVGRQHVCALKNDSSVRCWGGNGFSEATPPADLGEVQSVSAGDSMSWAIKEDGSLQFWGFNYPEQTQPPLDLGAVRLVSVGCFHACAVTIAGTVKCWGYNDEGETDVPSDLGAVISLSSGCQHVCAVREDGTVRCWSSDASDRLKVPEGLIFVKSSERKP